MTDPAAPGSASWCDACLGSQRCWVCDGAGTVERRWQTADCPSCGTSGRCRYCTRDLAAPVSVVLDAASAPASAGADDSAQG